MREFAIFAPEIFKKFFHCLSKINTARCWNFLKTLDSVVSQVENCDICEKKITQKRPVCFKCKSECICKDVPKSKDTKDLFGGPCDLCKRLFYRNCVGISSRKIIAFTAQTRILSYFCIKYLDMIRDSVKDLSTMHILNL